MSEQLEQNPHKPSRGVVARGLILSVLVLFGGIVLMRVLIKSRKKPKRVKQVQLTLKVQAKTVKLSSQMLYLKGFGTTVASRNLAVVPEVSGRVIYAFPNLKQGSVIPKRSLLFRIDPSNYRLEVRRLSTQIKSAKRQIAIGKRALVLHKKNLTRSERLLKRKALDRGSVERMSMQVTDREQRLEGLRQGLAIARVGLSRALLNLRKTKVYAPFRARVSQGTVGVGDFVSVGRSVIRLESVEGVEIPVAFSLTQLSKIRTLKGGRVDLTRIPHALKQFPPVEIWQKQLSDRAWKGRVIRLDSKVNLLTRTMSLFVKVQFRKGASRRTLLPGVFCSIQLPIRKLHGIVIVPKRALYGDRVYVVRDKKIYARSIKILHQNSEQVFVSGGLQEDDVLVISQLNDPIDGTAVSVVLAF